MNKLWPYRLAHIWWLFRVYPVHSTKPLELRGDAHDLHKPIKTEPRPELAHDLHSSHEMKSSVIRIPHEYGWVTQRHAHTNFERITKGFHKFPVCCSASPLTLYGSGGQRLVFGRTHICSCCDCFFKFRYSPKTRAGYCLKFFDTMTEMLWWGGAHGQGKKYGAHIKFNKAYL